MPTINKLRRTWQQEFDGKQDKPVEYPALMGRLSDKALKVTGRPGYIHVRIGNDEALAQARWSGPARYDLLCVCGYVRKVFRVLRLDQDDYVAAGNEPIPDVDAHSPTHLWFDPDDTTTANRASDPTFVSWRQIMELRVGKHTSGTFTVRIERGLVEYSNTITWVVTQTLDLTFSVPAWGARWVLIYLLPDGTVEKSDGTIVAKSSLTVADIPVPTFVHYRLAAVMLWFDQTQIRDDGGRTDIQDLRFPQDISAATGGGGETTTTVAITPRWHVDGPLAVYDEVDGVWRMGQAFEMQSAAMYLNDTGSSGTTIVDVEKSVNRGISWSTLFPTQANRPSIAAGAAKVSVGTPAIAAPLASGVLLRANIEAVAVGARGLTVHIFGDEGSIIASGILSAIMGVGR